MPSNRSMQNEVCPFPIIDYNGFLVVKVPCSCLNSCLFLRIKGVSFFQDHQWSSILLSTEVICKFINVNECINIQIRFVVTT